MMSSMVTPERAAEFHAIVRSVTAWADGQQDITGIAAVGSWARNQARMDSDLDLVVLTVDKQQYLTDDWWVPGAVGQEGKVIRTQDWGPLTERRVVLRSGFEIEFGFAAPSWASTKPLDAGTAHVVRDGCLPLHDPSNAFGLLVAAVRASSLPAQWPRSSPRLASAPRTLRAGLPWAPTAPAESSSPHPQACG